MHDGMGDTTRFIASKVDEFYENFDKKLETILDSENKEALSEFMETYILQFPSLGDLIFKYIYDNDSNLELSKKYTDYTLRTSLRNAEPVADYAAFYHKHLKTKIYPAKQMRDGECEAYILDLLKAKKITGAQAAMLQEDCTKHYNKFRENAFRKKLHTAKGYRLGGHASGVRNLVFHLAFALDMDDTKVSEILTKCLLMQDFNPKNHREVIYRWCLRHHIPYQEMISDYMAYYHSEAFVQEFQNRGIPSILYFDTKQLIDKVSIFLDAKNHSAFWEYLWRIKAAEHKVSGPEAAKAVFLRKTPREVFWEKFLGFPLKVFTAPGQKPPELDTFDDRLRQRLHLAPDAPLPEKISKENNILIRLELLEESRTNCYESNKEPLLPAPILQEIFHEIEYVEGGSLYHNSANSPISVVLDRTTGKAPIPRNLLIATMFIDYFSDLEYQLQKKHKGLVDKKRFVNSLVVDLDECGLYPFYERNPFELFLILCFLSKDPLRYFLSSWEHALRNN